MDTEKIDRIFSRVVGLFMLFVLGVGCGYAWAVVAYGVLK